MKKTTIIKNAFYYGLIGLFISMIGVGVYKIVENMLDLKTSLFMILFGFVALIMLFVLTKGRLKWT